MSYPIIIPIHSGGGKFKDDTELRYALRSIDQNFVGDHKIVIVGSKLPEWLAGVEFIPSHNGLKSALVDASRAYPWGFFWWYDDCCLLNKQSGEDLKVTPAIKRFGSAKTKWGGKLEVIRKRLEADGHVPVDYSRPHGPYWFDLAMVEDAFVDWPRMSGKFPFESWILSKRQWPWRQGVVKQYYGDFNRPPGENMVFLNYCNRGLTPELHSWLRERFPHPTVFEKQTSR